MGKFTFLVAIVAICVVSASALVYPPSFGSAQNDFPKQWMTQQVDHFASPIFGNSTFQQKYYINNAYFSAPDGPIFLYINGEGPVGGPPSDDFVTILAKKFGALIVTLEHRFYGESQPFGDLSLDSLKYLSSRQALADLADFRNFIQSGIKRVKLDKGLPHANSDNAWITIGGSYSGALSAWFRIKYPHLTLGSISSSGVVNAILEFTDFDKQIATSIGEECTRAAQALTSALETAMSSDPTGTKNKFGAGKLLEGDFWYMMADAQALPVQYGHQEDLCTPLVKAFKAGDDLVNMFAGFINDWFYKFDTGAPMDYSTELQSNTSEFSASRSWWWQKCSELAYFQIAYPGSIRSQKVTLDWHYQHCQDIFGVQVQPTVDETNIYYGATNIGGTDIFFHNGSQDWAGVRQSLGPDLPAHIAVCESCGHCVDLHKPNDDDPQSLVDGRNDEMQMRRGDRSEKEHMEEEKPSRLLERDLTMDDGDDSGDEGDDGDIGEERVTVMEQNFELRAIPVRADPVTVGGIGAVRIPVSREMKERKKKVRDEDDRNIFVVPRESEKRRLPSLSDLPSISEFLKSEWRAQLWTIVELFLVFAFLLLDFSRRLLNVNLRGKTLSHLSVSDSFAPSMCISFHPAVSTFAVASSDSVVHIHSLKESLWSLATLRDPRLGTMSSLAYRPFAGHVIAATGRYGVCIWTMTPVSRSSVGSGMSPPLIASPLVSPTAGWRGQRRMNPGESPFVHASASRDEDDSGGSGPSECVSVVFRSFFGAAACSWSPDGNFLFVGSLDSGSPILIDFFHSCSLIELPSTGGQGIRSVSWSPSGSYVFCGLDSGFCVYNALSWSVQRWSGISTVDAVWNSTGTVLIVAESGSLLLHCFQFSSEPSGIRGTFLLTEDLGAHGMGSGVAICGLSWDRTGSRLAVTVACEREMRRVALFAMGSFPSMSFSFRGFLYSSLPLAVAFKPVFDQGALLAIVRDGGEIGFVKMLFQNR